MANRMIVMVRDGLGVTVVPMNSVTLESHDYEISLKGHEDGQWGLLLQRDAPEIGQYVLICDLPGQFYTHPTDRTLHITVFDVMDPLEVQKTMRNLVRLTKRQIRHVLGFAN